MRKRGTNFTKGYNLQFFFSKKIWPYQKFFVPLQREM